MKKMVLTAAMAVLSLCAMAQQTKTDWCNLDESVIYKAVNARNIQVLYLAPVDNSIAVFNEKDSQPNSKVQKAVQEFRPTLQKSIQKEFKNCEVRIVDELPSQLCAGELALTMKYTEFSLGSSAARHLAGFGAGSGAMTIEGTLIGEGSETVMQFKHRELVGNNPFADQRDHALILEFEKDITSSMVDVLKELSKM